MVAQSKTPMPHTWLVSSFLTAPTRGFDSVQSGNECFDFTSSGIRLVFKVRGWGKFPRYLLWNRAPIPLLLLLHIQKVRNLGHPLTLAVAELAAEEVAGDDLHRLDCESRKLGSPPHLFHPWAEQWSNGCSR